MNKPALIVGLGAFLAGFYLHHRLTHVWINVSFRDLYFHFDRDCTKGFNYENNTLLMKYNRSRMNALTAICKYKAQQCPDCWK